MEGILESLDGLREHLTCTICHELCSESSHFLKCRHNFCSKHISESLSCLKCDGVLNSEFEKSVCTNEMVSAYNQLQDIFSTFKPAVDEITSQTTNIECSLKNDANPKRSIRAVRSRINTRSKSPPIKVAAKTQPQKIISTSPKKNAAIENKKNMNENTIKPLRRLRSSESTSKDVPSSNSIDGNETNAIKITSKLENKLNNSNTNKKSKETKNKDVKAVKKTSNNSISITDLDTEMDDECIKNFNDKEKASDKKFNVTKFIDKITQDKATPEISQKALEKYSQEKKNRKGETALHSACVNCNITLVKELLLGGANPNTKDNAGWTPLHEVVFNNRLDIAEVLLQFNALTDVPGPKNETPLHEAVRGKFLPIAEMLVLHGANIKAINIKGETPLSSADEDLKKRLNSLLINSSVSKIKNIHYSLHLVQSEMDNVIMYLSIVEKSSATSLQKLSMSNPALKIEKKLAKSTHVLVESHVNEVCLLSKDILYASVTGKWIISQDWTRDLDLSNIENYNINVLEGTSNGVELSRLNRYRQLPGLFNGCHFYFIGLDSPYEISATLKVDKNYLISLVEAGGGIVLKREPRSESIPEKEQVIPYHAGENTALEKCSHYIIYRIKPSLVYNMAHLKTLPLGWLIDCIRCFTLVDPS